MELSQSIILLPIWYVVFLLSLTCHEAAHAFAARRGGDETAYRGGQVTLNPLPHMMREPLGTILVPLITYFQIGWMVGWASAPYDPLWEARYPKRAALMAAAGPAANLILAVIGFAALRAGIDGGIFTAPQVHELAYDRLVVPLAASAGLVEGLGRLLSVTLVLNLVLFIFNVIPIPPMDGAAVLMGFVPAARRLGELSRASALGSLVGLVIAWLVFPHLFRPLLRWILMHLYA